MPATLKMGATVCVLGGGEGCRRRGATVCVCVCVCVGGWVREAGDVQDGRYLVPDCLPKPMTTDRIHNKVHFEALRLPANPAPVPSALGHAATRQ
jgi:hypothetical protein